MVDPYSCYICGVKNNMKIVKHKYRQLVEIHHISFKVDDGKDTPENLIPLCCNCHTKVHEELIKLDRWYFSTRGWVFHYFDENGNEIWK